MAEKPLGASAQGSSSVMETYEKKPDDDINKAADEGIQQVSEYVQKVGAVKKFSFSLDSIKKLGLDKLESIDGLSVSKFSMDTFSKNISNKLKGLVTGKLNFLKQAAQDSAKELIYIGKDFVVNLIQQQIDMIVSRIYIPDELIRTQLQATDVAGSNVRIYDDWIRSYMISIDYVKTVEWIDDRYGLGYSWAENKGRIKSDLNSASKNSCLKVIKYMMEYVHVERKQLDKKITNVEKWLEDYDLDKLEKERVEKVEEIEKVEDLAARKELEKDLDLILYKIEHSKKKREENPDMEKQLKKDKKTLNEIKKFQAKIFKRMIVYSYGNLNLEEMKSFVTKFDIVPANFGEQDEDFNSEFSFNDSDINKMAPFFKEHSQYNATNYTKDTINNRYGSQTTSKTSITSKNTVWNVAGSDKNASLDTSKNSQGAMANLQDSLGDTRLVQTSKIPQYIVPRNVYIKQIYAYIAEQKLFGADRLTHTALYERLKYPTMDMLTSALDDAAKNFFNTGLGKAAVDTLLYIEYMAYNLVNKQKQYFNSPSKTVYAQLSSYGQDLPAPVYDDDDLSNFVDKSNSNPSTGLDGSAKDKLTRRQLVYDLMVYYFENIRSSEYRKIFKVIFEKLYDMFNSLTDDDREISKNLIIKYFAPSIQDESTFNKENFIAYARLETIIPKMVNYIADCDGRYYEEDYEIKEQEVFDLFYTNHMKSLLTESISYIENYFYEEVVRYAMPLDKIYENIIYAYNFAGKQSVYITEAKEKENYNKLLKEWFSENAYTLNFDIKTYLKSKSSDERATLLISILKKMRSEYTLRNYSEFIRVETFKAILDNILPVFEASIGVEEKDYDIDDEAFKKMIYDKIMEGSNFTIYIKDFDNKLVGVNYESPIGDLDKFYDYEQLPNNNGLDG